MTWSLRARRRLPSTTGSTSLPRRRLRLRGRTSTQTARTTHMKKSQSSKITPNSSARRTGVLSTGAAAAAVRRVVTFEGRDSRSLEPEHRGPDHDLVAVGQDPLTDGGTVDPGAVRRVEVDDHHVVAGAPDLCVATTGVGVVDHDGALGQATD